MSKKEGGELFVVLVGVVCGCARLSRKLDYLSRPNSRFVQKARSLDRPPVRLSNLGRWVGFSLGSEVRIRLID